MSGKKEKLTAYKLSEASVKTSREFGYAARAASVLKQVMLPLVFGKYGNQLHKRLQARIISVLHTGPVVKQGERRLAHGNVALLKNLSFNPHTQFSTLAPGVSVDVRVAPETGQVHLRLRTTGNADFRWPERAIAACIDIQVVAMDVDELIVDAYKLERLDFISQDGGEPAERKASVPVTTMDNRLILVAAAISFCRVDSYGDNAHISHHQRYHAAYIAGVSYVRDGRIVEFMPDAAPSKSDVQPPVYGVTVAKWDES